MRLINEIFTVIQGVHSAILLEDSYLAGDTLDTRLHIPQDAWQQCHLDHALEQHALAS